MINNGNRSLIIFIRTLIKFELFLIQRKKRNRESIIFKLKLFKIFLNI